MKRKAGKIFLVGAGPGDPGLMTLRGAELLASCDVIVMDALVNPLIVANVRARVLNVGKRGRSRISPGHGPKQAAINTLLARLARAGNRVVRLKGGDPFVFGRGSEEIEMLRRKKIPYEIVPGVSSAVAAPAYAGIPVTDRRWASQVTFLTGHETAESREAGGVDWSRLSPDGTLVILMGVTGWPGIVERLLRYGWPPATPVAAIERGSTPRQRVLSAPLRESVKVFSRNNLSAPAVIVVGLVAALSTHLSWFREERPLLGRRIAVTRAADAADGFAARLSSEGADVMRCPLIDVRPISLPVNARSMMTPGAVDWIVFLSANGVRHFPSSIASQALKKKVRVFAIGPQTAEAARAAGWNVTRISSTYDSSSVLAAMGSVKGKSVFIPRAHDAPAAPVPGLKRAGAQVTVLSVYETCFVRPSPAERTALLERSEAVTFLSSSTVESFCQSFSRAERTALFRRATAVSIGGMTTRALRRAGIRNVLQARVSSRDGVVDALRRLFSMK